MSRIAIPTREAAPAASQPLLDAVNGQLGVVPNLFRLVALSPAALQGMLGLSGALSKALGVKTRERIALAVAQVNGCDYCLSAHTYLGLNLAKIDAAEIALNRRGASSDAKADAAVRFAAKVAEVRGKVTDADLAAVKAAGYSDAEVIEIVAVVAENVLTNFVNNVAGTDIDFPVVRADARLTDPGAGDAMPPAVLGSGDAIMSYGFLDIAATPSVEAAQVANGSRAVWAGFHGDRAFDRFTDDERTFIAARDSFYMATVSENGWPYVQHRGGPEGFLKVLDDRTLGFADYRGNRQYISLGNVLANDRAALILVDYPNRARLKLYAHVEPRDLAADPDLAARLVPAGYRAQPERALLLHLEAFDWNCPRHITPRFTASEVEAATVPLRERLTTLEAENAALKARLNGA